MNYLYGLLMALIGLFITISAHTKSNNIIYRLIAARSKILWGERVHAFLRITGLIIIGLSSLFFLGVWGI